MFGVYAYYRGSFFDWINYLHHQKSFDRKLEPPQQRNNVFKVNEKYFVVPENFL